ncbi:hypothetical protein BJ944DRAFT_173294 [Cunninghamella echinulata]|nr:hypothetical protein BJ944DRAFT_173294 [Cunninghamella echinulata]
MRCHNCGSGRVETDPSTGTTFCVSCGDVLEENNIVAEVTFQELSGGKTVLQGAYAGESGRISGGGPFGHGRGKEGQEQAIDNGRQRIARLAHGLRLPERYRESAQRYYNLAVINRFTRGRKSDHVAAVCLYIVCRNEESSQMLIDFSDLLQTNVFILGATFLKLVRVLCLKLPLIDPSIYISRFAAACDFGEYTHRVAQDAVRLAQRMDRDWIRTGRRPSGICGACLLIAARINGFQRTVKEMIYIVKVADQTIQKRLKEFGDTESANLTVRDFRDIWLETEADPPAYIKNRKIQIISEDSESESISTPASESTDIPSSSVSSPKENIPSQSSTLLNSNGKNDNDDNSELIGSTLVESQPESSQRQKESEDDEATQVENKSENDDTEVAKKLLANPELDEQASLLQSEMEGYMDDALKASEGLEKPEKEEDEEEEVSLSDVDDEEIEAVILSPEEVKIKSIIWYNENKEYLEEMEARARKIEMDKKNGVYTKRNKSSKRKKLPAASTPAEAAKQLLNTRKISKKINQAVFDDMFESAESIERIKENDRRNREKGLSNRMDDGPMEVVEESGDAPIPEKKRKVDEHGNAIPTARSGNDQDEEEDEEDDEEMDLDDMADDERLLLQAREQFGWDAAVTNEDYYDDYGDDDY